MKLKHLAIPMLFAFSVSAMAAEDKNTANTEDVTAIQPNGQNSTAVVGSGTPFGPESYVVTLRAPLIEAHTFPVPVPYIDDLLTTHKRLLATLNVPLRLSIQNSRKRRLLALFTLNGDQEIPYGAQLNTLDLIQLQSYKDSNNNKVSLTRFVGPEKRVFRSLNDGANITIDFILRITQRQFHNGYIKVAIASTNGVQLEQLCEVTATNCAKAVVFRVVPRKVVIDQSEMNMVSEYRKTPKTGKIALKSSNVDLKITFQGVGFKTATVIDHKELPNEMDMKFIAKMHDIHNHVRKLYKTRYSHVDVYPVPHYMSSQAYMQKDQIATSFSVLAPEFYTVNDRKASPILDRLDKLDTVVPFDGSLDSQENGAQPKKDDEPMPVAKAAK